MRATTTMLLAAAVVTALPGRAPAERRPGAFSAGVAGYGDPDGGTGVTAPLQLRLDLSRRWTFQAGKDQHCLDAVCSFFGLYRAGVMLRPLDGRVGPYAYGNIAFLLAGTHPTGTLGPSYDVGAYWIAGAGVEVAVTPRIGAYLEAGVIGDVGATVLEPTGAAGLLLRFGTPPG